MSWLVDYTISITFRQGRSGALSQGKEHKKIRKQFVFVSGFLETDWCLIYASHMQ
jgi:hypothetical protein